MKFLNSIDGASKIITDSDNRFVTDVEKQKWDNAVELKHPHNNKSIIDNFGYLNGELYYGETPLTFLPSEGGGDVLVHRYVHQGNKVIQPTGLNKETGLFTTTEPIALSPGTKRQVITAFNYQFDGSIPREWNGIDAHFIEVVDSYSFYILQGSASGARMTYTNTSNSNVDVNAFRFEYDYSNNQIIDLSALNIKNGKFRIKGTRHRPGWTYVYLDMTHDGGSYRHSYGTFADGRDYLSLDILGLFSIEDNFVSARIDNYIKSEWNQSNGTWRYSQGNNGSVLAGYFDGVNFDILTLSFAMSNGSIFEIYDITDSLNSGSGSVEIADNLITNDGTKALSAKQGKILNDNKVDNSRVLTDVPLNAKFTDTNTTYAEITTAEIDTGTASTLRTITGRRVKYILDKVGTMISTAISGLTKTNVGLGNVDNTSDLDKPVSTAMQTALDGKVDNSRVLTNVPANAKFTDTVYTHPTTHPYSMITGVPTSLPASGGDATTARHLVGDDTRAVNSAPSVYMNGGSRFVARAGWQTEFKTRTVINSPPLSGTYVYLQTHTPWSDPSGGYPIQIVYGNGIPCWRVGVSTTAWSAWQKVSDGGNANTVNGFTVGVNVPSNAKFTDTVTTINGKTGAISKVDIVALGVPSSKSATWGELKGV